jgi:hypothetical protein
MFFSLRRRLFYIFSTRSAAFPKHYLLSFSYRHSNSSSMDFPFLLGNFFNSTFLTELRETSKSVGKVTIFVCFFLRLKYKSSAYRMSSWMVIEASFFWRWKDCDFKRYLDFGMGGCGEMPPCKYLYQNIENPICLPIFLS